MKTIITCIVLFVCTTVAFAQRVKPTLPEPATIEEGKYYYLWNEDAELFVGTNNNIYDIAPYPFTDATFKFHATSEGTYNGKWRIELSDGRYFESSSESISLDNRPNFSYDSYFYVTQLEDGCYTIQRNQNYVESEYVGVANGIYANCTTNIKWRLIPADNIEAARMMLYLTLQNVDESYNTDEYDELLMNATTQAELLKAAKEMSTAVDFTNMYAQKSWSYPLFFINDSQYPWSRYSDYDGDGYKSYTTTKVEGYTSRLKAVVEVDAEEATLSYEADCSNISNIIRGKFILNVYIDGELVRTVPTYQIEYQSKYYHALGKGVHTIEWECIDIEDNNTYSVYIQDIGVEVTPTISVSLLEPGSLGTEILAQVNMVSDVRRLKVKGEMNDDDWEVIKNIHNLYSVDLSEATIKEIPDDQFDDSNGSYPNFYQVVLPEGLNRIGIDAFRQTEVEEINLPSTLTEIGANAFNSTLIKKVVIPNSVTELGNGVFANCYSLVEISYPTEISYIPESFFRDCHHLQPFELSESLKSIGRYAFINCYDFNRIDFPGSLTSIGVSAFQGSGIESITVPEGVTIEQSAFRYCSNLAYVELPTTFYDGSIYTLFHDCSNLKTIRLKSPTVLAYYSNYFINDDYRINITLQVPDYLVSAYKLNAYWCNFGKIEGFASSEIDTWTINAPLKLDAKSRFQGSPNIILKSTTLSMGGETSMVVNDFSMTLFNNNSYNSYSTSSQVLMSAETVVNGKLTLDYWTRAKEWFYVALPFDIRVGDIETSAQYAIRYYDGANRASTSAATGNWKNYTADDIIPAGTGFVFQTSQEGYHRFVAYENTNKNRAFAAKDLTTPLQENACAESAHKGWNLVGNPWMTWFNIHTVDFTAPITVYDHYYNRYQAYSIIDDDVALHPTQAFFVQCPDDIESITFPTRGRQLTNEITTRNSTRSVSVRRLVDVELSNDEATDRTRVVMNDNATLNYDYGSDAGKFFADTETVQLYTLDADGESYAINERPTDNGLVNLAFVAPTSGNYTLTLSRNQLGNVILKDLLLGTETNLSHGDYYFSSDAGTFTDRFVLAFNPQTTGMEEVLEEQTEVSVIAGGIQTTGIVQVFAADGCPVAEGEGFLPLKKGLYVVRANSESFKIVVK